MGKKKGSKKAGGRGRGKGEGGRGRGKGEALGEGASGNPLYYQVASPPRGPAGQASVAGRFFQLATSLEKMRWANRVLQAV